MKGYWLKEDKVFDVPTTHIRFIVDNPELFNLSKKEIESAKDKGRITFNQMIDFALQFSIKDLIFKNTDRMSRNYYDLLRITELIDKHDFNIHFYQTGRILNKNADFNERFILDVEVGVAKQLSVI